MFEGQTLFLATMHKKEDVIGPIVEEGFGVTCKVVPGINTDLLGTFSGEIPRGWDPPETMRRKNLMARQVTGCGLAMSSEGSFGPHPFSPFIAANEEWLMLSDYSQQREFVVRKIYTSTNFSVRQIDSESGLMDFANDVGFPAHAIILTGGDKKDGKMVKGITDADILVSTFHDFQKQGLNVTAETDMRAMHNPTRCNNIRDLAGLLVQKVNNRCPSCAAAGFGEADVETGLPCSACGFPTESVLHTIYSCECCGYRMQMPNKRGITHEDPMYCQFCNP